MTIVGDLDLSLKASISTVQRRESVLDQSNQLNLNAKVLYKEIALVEYQILNSQAISDLVSQNVFIPPGFNQNAIELIKQKDILLNIEKIANKMEDVSDVVKTILVKYA